MNKENSISKYSAREILKSANILKDLDFVTNMLLIFFEINHDSKYCDWFEFQHWLKNNKECDEINEIRATLGKDNLEKFNKDIIEGFNTSPSKNTSKINMIKSAIKSISENRSTYLPDNHSPLNIKIFELIKPTSSEIEKLDFSLETRRYQYILRENILLVDYSMNDEEFDFITKLKISERRNYETAMDQIDQSFKIFKYEEENLFLSSGNLRRRLRLLIFNDYWVLPFIKMNYRKNFLPVQITSNIDVKAKVLKSNESISVKVTDVESSNDLFGYRLDFVPEIPKSSLIQLEITELYDKPKISPDIIQNIIKEHGESINISMKFRYLFKYETMLSKCEYKFDWNFYTGSLDFFNPGSYDYDRDEFFVNLYAKNTKTGKSINLIILNPVSDGEYSLHINLIIGEGEYMDDLLYQDEIGTHWEGRIRYR